MIRFYFDTFDGREKVEDHEGVECVDRAAARREAACALADMARDALPDGQLHTFSVRIRDKGGEWFEAQLRYHGRDLQASRQH